MSTNILRYYLNIRRWSEILMAYINYYFRVITAYVLCTKYVGFSDVSQVETKYYLPIRDNNRHTQRLSIKHMFQQFDKSKFLSELQRFKINMLVVLRRGFFMYGKRVYISSTQSIQTSVQLWFVLVRLWIIWMTSYVSFFDPLSIKNVGPPARWVAVLAKFTANKPLFFATTNLTRLC